jgi:hypothetical protein
LSEEERGGHIQRLCAADSHQPGHHDGEEANDPLHDADVIEDREQGRHEDDRGQDPEREDELDWAVTIDQRRPENELGAGQGAGENRLDGVAGLAQQAHSGRNP